MFSRRSNFFRDIIFFYEIFLTVGSTFSMHYFINFVGSDDTCINYLMELGQQNGLYIRIIRILVFFYLHRLFSFSRSIVNT